MLSSCIVRDYWFLYINFTDGTYISENLKERGTIPGKPYVSFKLDFSKLEDDNSDYYDMDNVVVYRRMYSDSNKFYNEFYSVLFYGKIEGNDYVQINLEYLRFSHSNPNPHTWPTDGTSYFRTGNGPLIIYLNKNGIKSIDYNYHYSADMKLVKEG